MPNGAGAREATQAFSGRDPVTEPWRAGPASPPPPTEAIFPPPTGAARRPPPTGAAVDPPPIDVVRYGPGIPYTYSTTAGEAGLTAERVWRTGPPPEPPRRRPRLRRMFGSALTVILLAAAAVVLFLRFHHAPFQVTGAVISPQTRTGCAVDVTGRINTNGAAGTVSYQWLFRPDQHPPQPLTQSVTAGQQAVYVTVAVEGSGHGSASQTVTLQVLGPDRRSTSTAVVIRC